MNGRAEGDRALLVILGASGHAAVVADAARASGRFAVAAFLTTGHWRAEAADFDGVPVLSGFDAARSLLRLGARIVVAVGSNRDRRRLSEDAVSYGFERATVVHPAASVAWTATIGPGSVVLAGAVVGPRATLGEDVIVNHGATVDHDCILEAGVHLSPGVHLGGRVRVGEEAWLGVGVSVRDRTSIGAGTLVGVGAAVVRDLPPGVVAYGVPASPVREL